LSVRIVAPTFERVVIEDGTDRVIIRDDFFCSPPTAEIDWEQIVTHFVGIITQPCGGILAELTVVIQSPTFDRAVIENRARRISTGGDCCGSPVCTQIHGGQGIAQILIVTIRVIAVA
jgi:hypothetical protein